MSEAKLNPTQVDVAIVGAGPYGLSLAAHLTVRGVEYRIFGSPMHTWRHRMPNGMRLRSPGFGSDLSEPTGQFTLTRYWARSGRTPESLHDPIPRDAYLEYTQWFLDALAIPVEDVQVRHLARAYDGYSLDLDTGERVRARRVVLAVGLTHFAYVPPELASLPVELVTHSTQVVQPGDFARRDVVVVGAGQSALETAALLREGGASVRVVARCQELMWTGDPIPSDRPLLERLLRPDTRLCAGWRCWLYDHGGMLFHLLPERKRLQLVRSSFGPMGAWWLRSRLEDVEILLGRSVASASVRDGEVELQLRTANHTETISTHHVIAATGYRIDLNQLEFLDKKLRLAVRTSGTAPALSRAFESSVPGLHFVGAASAASFGPVTRFVAGTTFTARTLARYLNRRARRDKIRRSRSKTPVIRRGWSAAAERDDADLPLG